jgi:hypothetical protein
MSTIIYNNNISQVKVYRKSKYYSSLEFRTGRKKVGTKFWIIPIYQKVEALFYDWAGEYWGTVEEYNTGDRETFFEDGVCYYKPHCSIYLNNGKHEDVYFDTVEKLDAYVEELKNLAPHIILK